VDDLKTQQNVLEDEGLLSREEEQAQVNQAENAAKAKARQFLL
jgi:hypothetical protein